MNLANPVLGASVCFSRTKKAGDSNVKYRARTGPGKNGNFMDFLNPWKSEVVLQVLKCWFFSFWMMIKPLVIKKNVVCKTTHRKWWPPGIPVHPGHPVFSFDIF